MDDIDRNLDFVNKILDHSTPSKDSVNQSLRTSSNKKVNRHFYKQMQLNSC